MKSYVAMCLCLMAVLTSGLVWGQQALPAQVSQPDNKTAGPPPVEKIGPFDISVNWRTRAEGWDWFQGNTGNSEYPFWDSLLRVGIGQKREKLDWFIERNKLSILGLPNGRSGRRIRRASLVSEETTTRPTATSRIMPAWFFKAGLRGFQAPGTDRLKLGRFEYFDGAEVKPKDPTLARSSRLVSRAA